MCIRRFLEDWRLGGCLSGIFSPLKTCRASEFLVIIGLLESSGGIHDRSYFEGGRLYTFSPIYKKTLWAPEFIGLVVFTSLISWSESWVNTSNWMRFFGVRRVGAAFYSLFWYDCFFRMVFVFGRGGAYIQNVDKHSWRKRDEAGQQHICFQIFILWKLLEWGRRVIDMWAFMF